MSLNGNLEVFPLEEVLRLLARSRKSGCLRVESGGIQGRVFLKDGALTLATVAGDDELRRRLVAAGVVTEADLRKVELSGAPVSEVLAPEVTPAALSEFVREESVEGLYRIRRSGRGNFDFLMDLAPRYPSGQSYDSEVIVSEADRRALEWQDVESVLPGMDAVVRMVPALDGEESVTLSPSTWRILAVLGAGTSAGNVGRSIGWSDFKAAREIASLLRAGLVTTIDGAVAPQPEVADQPPVIEARTEPAGPPESDTEVEDADLEPSPAVVEPEPEPVAAEAESVSYEGAPSETHAAMAEEPAVEPTVEPFVEDESSGFEGAVATGPEAPADPVAPFEGWASEPVQSGEEPVVDEAADSGDAPEDDAASWWSDTPVVRDVAVEDDFLGGAADGEAVPGAEPLPSAPWGANPWTAEIPTDEPEVRTNPWGGWASASSEVTPEVESPAEAVEADPVAAGEDQEPAGAADDNSGGWWAQTMGAAESETKPTDNDADRFLESVFSSLSEESEPRPDKDEDEDETGFGMGLLRRRRMGAAARDIDNDR